MSIKYIQNLKKLKQTAKSPELPGLLRDKALKERTQIGLGGVADYFLEVENLNDLVEAVKFARQESMPYVVFGKATSVLLSDVGFPGLIIINKSAQFNPIGQNQLLVQSGVNNYELVNQIAPLGLSGIEFLATIPGTIGGSLIAGASGYDEKLENFVKETVWLFADGAKETKIVNLGLLETKDILRRFLDQEPLPKNLPVLLSIKLGLRKLNSEEVITKIQLVKKRDRFARLLGKNILGYFFDKQIPFEVVKNKQLARFFKGKLRLSKENPNILIKDDELIDSSAVAAFIEDVRQALFEEIKEKYQYNIFYYGHWPKE